jgi:hypothetical protein
MVPWPGWSLAAGRTVELFIVYRKGKGPAELHVFQKGGHSFVNKGGGADHFMDRLEEWLAANKLLSKPKTETSSSMSYPFAPSGKPGGAGCPGTGKRASPLRRS